MRSENDPSQPGMPSGLFGLSTPTAVSHTKAVVLYARASRKRQINSVEDQLKVLREFCRQKGYEIIAEYSDVASGKYVKNRPGFADVRQAIRGKACQSVLVHEFSRFGRKVSNLLKLHELAEQFGVQLESTNMGILTNMHVMALGMVAQIQLDVATDQIKRAHQSNILDGLRAGGKAYGYSAVQVNGQKGHLEIVPEEAAVVREIFGMVEDGLKPTSICRSLNLRDNPIPSPTGAKWRSRTLTDGRGVLGLLHNPVYKGYVAYNRIRTIHDADTEKSKQELRPSEEWWIGPGVHDSIIDIERFDRVQEILRNKAGVTNHTPGPPALFSARFKCPYCLRVNEDGSISFGTMSPVRGGRVRIQCVRSLDGACTNRRSFYRDEIYRVVLDGMVKVLREPTSIEKFLEQHALEARSTAKEMAAKLERNSREVASLDREITQLYSAIAKGGDAWRINAEIRQRETARRRAEAALEALATEMTEFKLEPASVEKYLSLVETISTRLQKSPTQASTDIELMEKINTLVDRIVVHPHEKRGFEVEVVGKLAVLVSGSDSFSASFCQDLAVKQLLDGKILKREKAAEGLKMVLFRAQGNMPLDDAIISVLANDMTPVHFGEVQQRLSQIGIICTKGGISSALFYSRDRHKVVSILRQGLMLRTNYEKLDLKFFRSIEQLRGMTCKILAESETPLRTRDLIKRLAERGMCIAGDEATSLRNMRYNAPHLFERKGHRWKLAALPNAEYSA